MKDYTVISEGDVVDFIVDNTLLVGCVDSIAPDENGKMIAKICNVPGKFYFVDADKIARKIDKIEEFEATIDGESLYKMEGEKPNFVFGDNDNLISVSDYAKIHKVSPDTVRQKILRGSLKAVKDGRNWRINKDEPYVDYRVRTGEYSKKIDGVKKEKIDREYSKHFPLASEAIASNGIKILERPLFSQYIKTTEIKTYKCGLVHVEYLDNDDKIIAWGDGYRERFPVIGYVEEIESDKKE